MSKNIEPKLKKIGDYLKLEEDTVFTIPEYQRAYSWGIDNCDKLWQDINDFVESESKDRYFFGTIIINCQDNDTKYGLIDGQQRTTTFLLLKHIDTGRMVFYFQETDSCKNVPFDVNHFSYDKIEDSVEIKTKTKARIMKILEQAKNGEI